MNQTIEINEGGLQVVIEISDTGDVRLLHFSSLPFARETLKGDEQAPKFRLFELQFAGENKDAHHGVKHIESLPGKRMVYRSHSLEPHDEGTRLSVVATDPVTGVEAMANLQFHRDIPIATVWTVVTNRGAEPIGLEYASTFALNGLAKEGPGSWGDKMRLHLPHNSWYGELQWRSALLPELGLSPVNRFTLKRVGASSLGSWSSAEYLPMGCLENEATGTSLFWQIEHNGSWHWEIGDHFYRSIDDASTDEGHLYLRLGGPTEQESHWFKRLAPGESFETVPAAVGAAPGDLTDAARYLTEYRRKIVRPHEDHERLSVIFNDFMNCLFGDPTSDKIMPLVDAAAEAGCEIYCIDAGWYADGEWWDGVGEWLPSQARFPNGIEEVIARIRERGMIPGLWLELEVMGVNCPLAATVPDDWFFCRHGRRAIDNGRYQLDYRHPAVRAYASGVVRRLVETYGVGYIKMDYNINIGVGNETNADSFGDGLLQHNRAYLAWLEETMDAYPQLVIEHCSSGGMRLDYAMLRRHPVASVSDQTDARKLAVIAAASPTALLPVQAAIWSYPLMAGDREETIFNMANAMLLRIHQSGHLAELDSERKALVAEGIAVYKTIRSELRRATPFWPLGIPRFGDGWIALGMRSGHRAFMTVWRLNGPYDTADLPLAELGGDAASVRCLYPAAEAVPLELDVNRRQLRVTLCRPYTARVLEFELAGE
ncbi:glycoside hydrolase family 36 protein [Cohnella sp. GbtcB17]|uniref:glycoside hydrolase family 36 protein n=1 Tax=Cohnella sp. GbtcB17 TaxID=2824762 RepID=UPI001C308D1E|nr:glycoside hydrolase family 36 protein [Cohnella sp. GbtcB17]